MTDCFALLEEPRRPWLDGEALKARFLSKSSELHPDRFHGAPEAERTEAARHFAELNTAYQCLAEPRERLHLLLELEMGCKPPNLQRIPPGTMELFQEVGQVCREVDAFLARRAGVTSPLLRVKLFQEGMEWTDRLNGLQRKATEKGEALSTELQAMNAAWESAPAVGAPGRAAALPLERLEQIYRLLSYVSRWTEQLRERIVQLAS